MYESDYLLTTDSSYIQSLTAMRVMVGAALLYTFTIHYVFLAIAYFFNDDIKIERIYDHGRRLVFYGIAAILSINFLQYGIYHAIMAWITLICVFVLHSLSFMRENMGIAIYYSFIGVWFFGIVFFYLYNANN